MRRLFFALILPVALAACEEKHDQGWLGYGEGDSAMISAPQAGWVTELKVERGTVLGRIAAFDVVIGAVRIGADHQEPVAFADIAMAGASRNNDHIASPHGHGAAARTAERNPRLAGGDAEHFVRITVEMVIVEYPVTPGVRPAIAGKTLFHGIRIGRSR